MPLPAPRDDLTILRQRLSRALNELHVARSRIAWLPLPDTIKQFINQSEEACNSAYQAVIELQRDRERQRKRERYAQ